jgi:hypothetical protein
MARPLLAEHVPSIVEPGTLLSSRLRLTMLLNTCDKGTGVNNVDIKSKSRISTTVLRTPFTYLDCEIVDDSRVSIT